MHFLAQSGLVEGRDYQSLRFDTDLGKHGDTGTSEIDVLRAILNGEADAGAVGSPFWAGVLSGQLVPAGAVESIWSSQHYHHCMFTARVGFPVEDATRFTDALFRMNGEPRLRPILDAEGLKEWVPPRTEGYGSLREAALRTGLFRTVRPEWVPCATGPKCEPSAKDFSTGLLNDLLAALQSLADGELLSLHGPARLGPDLDRWARFTGNAIVEVTS